MDEVADAAWPFARVGCADRSRCRLSLRRPNHGAPAVAAAAAGHDRTPQGSDEPEYLDGTSPTDHGPQAIDKR